MNPKILAIGLVFLATFSLCISEDPSTPTIPETTPGSQVGETEPPETEPASPPPTTTCAPSTSAPSSPPPKKEVVVAEEQTQDTITVCVEKLYYVNEPKYGSSGALEDHLRVELVIRNDGDDTIEFYPNITSIIEDDHEGRYVVLSMPSSKDWGEIIHGESREGYIAFPVLDEDVETISLLLRNDTVVFEFIVDIHEL